ncbi:FG-GAP-like repeat-containing protein [Nonomuraea sp. ATR24]|uniref:FG-GAP-like repeat-containing protein n=1 Tax=unclassified Nonomuraea TaxID=2593643 RepID=UPI00340B2729
MSRRLVLAFTALLITLTACDPGAGAAPAGPTGAASPADRCAKASARDFDGDGHDDVAVGNRMLTGGQVSILSAGKLVHLRIPDLAADAIGSSVALARVNADGCADVVVGAPYTKVDGGHSAGAVYVLYGGNAAPYRKIVSPNPQPGARFGAAVAAHGGTIAIGAPEENDSGVQQAGAVYVTDGDTTPPRRITQETEGVPGNSEPHDGFGATVAVGPLPDGRTGLLVGSPRERDDGSGRQLANGIGPYDGAVTMIADVRAERLEAVKHDGGSECELGDAVAYVPGGTFAATEGQCGNVLVLDHARILDTVECGACGSSSTGSALAAAPDGRVAVAWGDSAQVLSMREGVPGTVVPTLPGGNLPVAFYGTKLVFGMPQEAPPLGVTVFDPATGRSEQVMSAIRDVEGVGEALG